MPIARDVTFRCPKCGYTITKTIGDVIYPTDFLVNCPKCGTKMVKVEANAIIELIKKIFK